MNYYASPSIIDLPVADRATFIRRTYAHLAGAVGVFVILEALLLNSPLGAKMAETMMGGRWTWIIVLGAFMLVSHVAHRWAASAANSKTQYAGLGLYVLAQVIIFAPLLFLAQRIDTNIIPKAGMITSGLFLGLTWVAFTTKKDFSFMGGFLRIGMWVALGVIVASIVFGFDLGTIFSSIMVLLLAGCVLHDTSNVIHHYGTNQHVAASLSLFASFATLLWYVIQILISLRSDH